MFINSKTPHLIHRLTSWLLAVALLASAMPVPVRAVFPSAGKGEHSTGGVLLGWRVVFPKKKIVTTDPATPPSDDGLLRKMTDPLLHSTRFSYDARGNVLTVTDALNRTTQSTYYADSTLLHTTTDALGNVTTFTYDGRGNLDTETRTVTVRDAAGNVAVQTLVTDQDYDGNGWFTRSVDARGHATEFTYDAVGNRLTETTTRTLPGGALATLVTEHEYDADDRLVRSWDAEHPRALWSNAPTSETVYDENGKAVTTYDALRRATMMTYNDRGELVRTDHADGTFETTTYDADGRRETSTDRRGKTMRTIYDAMGRVAQSRFEGSAGDTPITLSSATYDAVGAVHTATDHLGRTSTHIYDEGNRRVASVNALNQRRESAYDAVGNVVFSTDALGRVTENRYDALNRRFETEMPAAALDSNGDGLISSGETSVITTAQVLQDELGRRVSETDASGKTKRFVYDELGRLTDVVDALEQVTHYTYDELGNVLTQTDANGHTTSYTYDHLGRRRTRTLPSGQVETMSYNAVGAMTSRTDFNGTVWTYTYDALNRLLTRTSDHPNAAASNVTFTYTTSGQRATMTDASGTTTYTYDSRDRLATKATPQGTLTYTYDDLGNLTSITSSNAGGTAVTYRYDELNRLKEVEEGAAEITHYTYTDVGSLQSVHTPNGVTHAYTYNALNRLTDLQVTDGLGTTLASYAYTQLKTGHRSSANEQFAGNSGGIGAPPITPATRSAKYQYDNLYRLKKETLTASTGPAGVADYTLDPVGNRLTRASTVAGLSNQTFTYTPNDWLTTDTYDANGNTTTGKITHNATGAETTAYTVTDTYTPDNRLTHRTSPNGTVSIVYDGDGHKVRETVNGQTITYLVDTLNPTGYAQVVEELQNGTVIRTYTYGHDLLMQDNLLSGSGPTATWQASWFLYDGHGSVRALTDGTSQLTDRYDYDAFGTLLATTGTTPNRYRYCGEQFDDALGLYYLRARHLNAANGRFWSMDSYEGNSSDPQSLHKYLYCESDPVNCWDPSGNSKLTETLAWITIVSILVIDPLITYIYDSYSPLTFSGMDPRLRTRMSAYCEPDQVSAVLEQALLHYKNNGKTNKSIETYFAENDNRYVYHADWGFIDLQHVTAASALSSETSTNRVRLLGEGNEYIQWAAGRSALASFIQSLQGGNSAQAVRRDWQESALSEEDELSNELGMWLNGGTVLDPIFASKLRTRKSTAQHLGLDL